MPSRFASGRICAYFNMTFSCWRTLVCEVVIRCLFVGYQAHATDQVHTKVAKNFVCFCRESSQWARASSCTGFLDHTQTTHHSRLDSSGRVISSSRRPLPDNTHNTQNRQTSRPLVVFEPTISAGERPQNYVLNRAATGTGGEELLGRKILRYAPSPRTMQRWRSLSWDITFSPTVRHPRRETQPGG